MDMESKLNRERGENKKGLMHWERIEFFKNMVVKEVDKA